MDENLFKLLGAYKLVLGLEVHLQLNTEKKMFCSCDAHIWQAEPNTHVCPVCLGLPGALPAPNYEAIRKAQLLGLALHCTLNKNSRFDRKHYFYPDLPKGYQISQYKQPFSENGYLDLESGSRADIERVHLEEDVAKSFHESGKTLIDFNKSSMPLVEIVSRPTFTNISDAVDYCKQIQGIVRFLGIGDVDMEKGQMRLEANISLRTPEMEKASELPKYKVEIKNINSFRFMEKAVLAEIVRQRELLEKGEMPVQENRGFNEATGKTVSQRSKEEAHDYRYFPEPDIPPMVFDDEYIGELKKELPELPYEIKKRLVDLYKITGISAKQLIELGGTALVSRFEEIVKLGINAQKAANVIINKKEILEKSPEEVVDYIKNLDVGISDVDSLEPIVKQVIEQFPKAIEDYKAGKENSVQFLLGQVMKMSQGKAKPDAVKDLIVSLLSK